MTPEFIIQAALNSTATWATRNRIDEISRAADYAEPGCKLKHPEKEFGIFLGDWNEPDYYDRKLKRRVRHPDAGVIPRLKEALEKVGANVEWSCNWASCDNCGALVRITPTCWYWEPFFVKIKGEIICKKCHKPEDDS